jgi:hypothetical protein
MYGIPTGAAVTGAGVVWPFQEATRKYMLENGHQYDHNKAIEGLTNGLIGMSVNMVYGEPTNFSTTYTPQGLDVFKDALKGDKGLFDLIMGAGGSILYQNIEAMAPAVASVYRSFGADGGHVLSVRDWSDAFSNISTLGNLAKAWHAYKFQEYTTKNENTIVRQEVTAAQALMTSLTGIIPRTVEDAYLMAESLKDRKGAQEEIRREAIKNLRLG